MTAGDNAGSKWNDAQVKQITDTVNKQRRLVEMFQMKSIMDGDISLNEMKNVITASQATSDMITQDSAGHAQKTIKAAMSLSGATMMLQVQAQQLQAQQEEKAKAQAKADSKKTTKKTSKAATKKN
tara:strand:- start:7246 stop:7623 length:378 start_codon:yes stop_codon:yes gene_type:complete